MRVVAIIPARYGSTRLPGKPLADIGGKPMIQHVYESASKARTLDRVMVATDDRRIEAAVRGFGGEVMMTSRDHASGTDRLAEVARKIEADCLVNIQGDLPFIHAETISRAVRPLRRDLRIAMGTVGTPIIDEKEWRNPNVVKVLTDRAGFALYFSRAPIPYYRNSVIDLKGGKVSACGASAVYGHIAISASMFTGATFCSNSPGSSQRRWSGSKVWSSCGPCKTVIGFMSRKSMRDRWKSIRRRT
jgi:3-deoxy-D-manno-octulosonate cytidylyltransferase